MPTGRLCAPGGADSPGPPPPQCIFQNPPLSTPPPPMGAASGVLVGFQTRGVSPHPGLCAFGQGE